MTLEQLAKLFQEHTSQFVRVGCIFRDILKQLLTKFEKNKKIKLGDLQVVLPTLAYQLLLAIYSYVTGNLWLMTSW